MTGDSEGWNLAKLGTKITTTGEGVWPMPVNLKWLIWNAQKTFIFCLDIIALTNSSV
jgi:hypothetical protein